MKSSKRILFAVVGVLLLAVVYSLYSYAIDSPYRISSDDAKKRTVNYHIKSTPFGGGILNVW
jgi:hypothetical protein